MSGRCRRSLTSALVAVAALAVAACSGTPPAARPSPTSGATGPTVTISLFHATHFDGAWVPDRGPTFAQYAAVLRAARDGLPAGQGSLFLGNGDDIADVVEDVSTGGMLSIRAFNAAGLDVDTYGFNELAFGLDRLAPLLPRARYTYVSANVRDRRTGQVYGHAQGARAWVIRDVGGVRVGLTGVISVSAARDEWRWAAAGVRVVDPVRALRDVVPKMRRGGAQLVVVMSHMENDEARRAAREVRGITAILGTHCCDLITPPQVVHGTLIAVPPFGLGAFGRLDLTVRGSTVLRHELRTYDVPTDTSPDPEVQAVIDAELRG